MDITEDKIIAKYAKQCIRCTRNSKLPYDYEWIGFAYRHNVIKRKK